jgi:hypothetical protein
MVQELECLPGVSYALSSIPVLQKERKKERKESLHLFPSPPGQSVQLGGHQ